jgi:molybdopterin-guanine dinucleotide biosynthesis protein B/molybdopterin-guanine dinucleotide biosynthesis protein
MTRAPDDRTAPVAPGSSGRPDSSVRVGVVIAGGRSRRTGVDKRYLVLRGRTLLQRNLEFLRDLFPVLAVSVGVGQELDLGDTTGVELLPDAYPGASPLAGIVTALERFDAPLFALAADIAAPDAHAAARVLAACPGRDVSIPVVGPHLEPLFAVYGPGCLAPMRVLLAHGRHRIVDAFPALDVVRVPFPDAAPFHNINTMDDFESARRHLDEATKPAIGGGSAGASASSACDEQPALVAVVGKSDSGKTTLVERLIPELTALGLRVGSVKHDAHSFEIDHRGKDSWRHGQAGGEAYAVASPKRLAFVTRLSQELPIETIARGFFAGFDIVVAEGYKRTAPHKVEIFRRGAGHDEPLCAKGEALAFVTDADVGSGPRFALDDAQGLAHFLAARLDALRDY